MKKVKSKLIITDDVTESGVCCSIDSVRKSTEEAFSLQGRSMLIEELDRNIDKCIGKIIYHISAVLDFDFKSYVLNRKNTVDVSCCFMVSVSSDMGTVIEKLNIPKQQYKLEAAIDFDIPLSRSIHFDLASGSTPSLRISIGAPQELQAMEDL